ncbi:MAG: PstS family phosphate ABC transporter substrate-binding protein [Immundisolibacter sp.]|uniref:PstS family phosphate ABC transporter substrate-binding protein n=1 Tax=Immundisolibacter sp. TaxID=1934948 RepID=UPI003EE06689
MTFLDRSIKATRVAILVAALGGGLSAGAAHAAGLIQIDGSSTVYPITEAVAEEFQAASGGTHVTVGISGTGGGFKRFCRGETDISDASRPILREEMITCAQGGVKYMELPVAYDAITVVVSKSNDFVDYLTVDELKKMWEPGAQGKVTSWKQIREGFPDVPLKLAGPGADSGTFDYFTEAVVGKSKSSRGDYQASEDDNVIVQFVSREKGALGYFGLAYYEENKDKLKGVPIRASASAPGVLPSLETVNNGSYQPLSRPIFIYVKAKAAERPEVTQFVEFYLKHGAELSKEVGYVDLPASAYELALKNFHERKLGTGFGGTPEVGLHVEDLLKREGKL